jgi:hypothetical protein
MSVILRFSIACLVAIGAWENYEVIWVPTAAREFLIQYSLPEASYVTIDIYDILGRKIETLVQGVQPAGYHQVIWHASNQSSGTYFYRIQAGEYDETRKMVLLK